VLPLDAEQRREVYRRACLLHGTPYDYRALFIYLAWSRLWDKRRGKLRVGLDNPKKLTCNQGVAACIGGIIPYIHADPEHPEHLSLTPEEFFETLFSFPSPSYLRGKEAHRHIIDRGNMLVP